MRKQNSDFEARFISEEGSRLENKDYFGSVELDEYACYVIADGITETSGVESARLAIETIILAFQARPSISKRTVKGLLRRANKVLLGKDSDARMKASITVVVTDYQKMRYGYAGNTRLRMYRGGAVYMQTKDMSLAQEMLDQDKIAKDELMRHEERNNLYTYLGQKKFSPVVSKKIKLVETDMVALYTRGIWENVDEAELDDVFAEADNEVQGTVDSIEDVLLSRQPENLDNYTLAVIFINKVYRDPKRSRRIKKIVIISVIVIVVIAIICLVLWFLHRKKVQRIEDMNYHFTNTVEYINTGNYVRAAQECKEAQELAKKLRDSGMKSRLQEYLLVIETVVLADESYSAKDYETAGTYYLSAMDRARYADNVGTDYMDKKLDNISMFLAVDDYLTLGDTLLEQGDFAAAEEKYLLAQKTALSIHDSDGKQRALDALDKLYQEKADAASQEQEAAASQIQEGNAAADLVVSGDKLCLEMDYVGAKVYYTMAIAKYAELADEAGQKMAQEKLDAADAELAQLEAQRAAAMEYERQGEACRQSGDLWGAKSQYLSAKAVYQKLGSDEDVQKVEQVINDIDEQIRQAAQASEAVE